MFRLFGYAGFGKTTLAKELAEGVNGTVLFGAFIGKAVLVLRRKGCANAATVHSIIYRAHKVVDTDAQGRETVRIRYGLNRLAEVAAALALHGPDPGGEPHHRGGRVRGTGETPGDSPILQAALAHAAAGRLVFPCNPIATKPNSKAPLVPKESAPGAKDGGRYLASTDTVQIRAWWAKHPRAVIGMRAGAMTGTLLIDVDPKAQPADVM